MADKVTLKIPRPLYEHIQTLIEGSGFNSVTDFVVFVLRDLVYQGGKAQPEARFSGEELENIKDKLRQLGYL
jgi:Arc/MetJ-type ribon-helix-helix transcriptional regulator